MTKTKFGDTVKVRFKCKQDDGSIIDLPFVKDPYSFVIGKGAIGLELELATLGMEIGEIKSISLPAYKVFSQYSDQAAGRTLFFDIELLDILQRQDFQEIMKKTDGMISLEEAFLLYNLAKDIKEHCIVEVGSYRGRSTIALGLGSLDGNQVPVYAIEPHEDFIGVLGGIFGAQDRGWFYKAMLDSSCYLIVRLINLSSEKVAPNWDRKIGLLWIDGDHTYEGVKRDFNCWFPHIIDGAMVAFDDSTNTQLGPYRLIEDLLATRKFEVAHIAGKITVLKFNKT
jgi:hypothetical protein